MKGNKTQYLGARFTEKERDAIISFVNTKENYNLTDFIREAIFSHIQYLAENMGNIEVDFCMKEFSKIDNSINILQTSLKKIKNELAGYDLAKIINDLQQESNFIKNKIRG